MIPNKTTLDLIGLLGVVEFVKGAYAEKVKGCWRKYEESGT